MRSSRHDAKEDVVHELSTSFPRLESLPDVDLVQNHIYVKHIALKHLT